MELTHKIMYQASLNRDTSFEGLFFTSVKTTGIFCRPSCTARKPKIENVEFFKTSKQCLLKDYRPCKVCKPLEKLNETPLYLKQLIDELSENPSIKFKDYDLVKRGLEPSQIRRWFIKNHGITFQAYQRMFRINSAFKKIQTGESITETAFDTGFESLSGFGDSFKMFFGISPKNSISKRIIDLKRMETPIGTMYACAVEDGICLLKFTDRKMLETELKILTKLFNATIIQGNNKHFNILEKELTEYFAGYRKEFSISLSTPGSEFQNTVWKELRNIPYATTKTYKQQAEAINNPNSIGAVAKANGMNRISIIIPCHRVIGSDRELTDYGGATLEKKIFVRTRRKKRQVTAWRKRGLNHKFKVGFVLESLVLIHSSS